jgi:probable rRNA maturation factor
MAGRRHEEPMMTRPHSPAATVGDGDDAATPDTEPPQRLEIDIVEEAGDWSMLAPIEGAVAEVAALIAALPDLGPGPAVAVVALVDDAMIADLNGRWRGNLGPTNVLSFPPPADMCLPPEAPRALGDIAIAAETLHHFQHLVLHGLLHLLGHDHIEDDEAGRMEALETRLLARLGIADPYAETAPRVRP